MLSVSLPLNGFVDQKFIGVLFVPRPVWSEGRDSGETRTMIFDWEDMVFKVRSICGNELSMNLVSWSTM
jgi:hypothetical protein